MQRQLLLSQFASQPWAMEPTHLANMASVLQRWASGEPASAEAMETVRAAQAARSARKTSSAAAGGTVAVLPVFGVMAQRANMADEISGAGGTSTEQFTQKFRAAMADDSVIGILPLFDTPGGSVFGIEELANEIYSARGKKPVIGLVSSLCASAGYWLGSQCEELYSVAGGMIGSIGVYTQHVDVSAAMEKSGIKQEFIAAGRYKVEGNQYGPLTDEARAFMQSQIDAYYASFTKAVARGRGVNVSAVLGGMGQGRCLLPADAMAANMINGIDTMDGVVARIVQRTRSGGTAQGATSMSQAGAPKWRLEAAKRKLQLAALVAQDTERERAAIDAAKRKRAIQLAKLG